MQRNLPDVDTLRKLAIDNPVELEQLRRQLAQQIIDQAAPKNRARLQGLQFQIDAHRQTAPNPVAACVKIAAMMQASFERLHSTLNVALDSDALSPNSVHATSHRAPSCRVTDMAESNTTGTRTNSRRPISARVIPFKRR